MRAWFATVVVIAIARGGTAAADDAARAPATTPWQLVMVGGVEQPLGASKTAHVHGLDAGMRLSWTSRIGLGAYAAVDYSPLPHAPDADGTRFDTTFATASIGPRFATGWSRLGVAVEAGGGVAIDHTREQTALQIDGVTSTTEVAPALQAGVEIELTVVSGGGIVVTGGGARAFGAVGYEYAWGMGGLALSF
jgi:hypothetical protein